MSVVAKVKFINHETGIAKALDLIKAHRRRDKYGIRLIDPPRREKAVVLKSKNVFQLKQLYIPEIVIQHQLGVSLSSIGAG